jgi:hypothetical protein
MATTRPSPVRTVCESATAGHAAESEEPPHGKPPELQLNAEMASGAVSAE